MFRACMVKTTLVLSPSIITNQTVLSFPLIIKMKTHKSDVVTLCMIFMWPSNSYTMA